MLGIGDRHVLFVFYLISLTAMVSLAENHPNDPAGEEYRVNAIRNTQFVRDTNHLATHMKGRAKIDLNKVSQHELDFHFFQLHDFDDNNHLDGIELYQSIAHASYNDDHSYRRPHSKISPEEKARISTKERHAIRTVDLILAEDDTDGDGYIAYLEFAQARRHLRDITQLSD